MSDVSPKCPPILGLFQKRIEGDDALLELARLRFQQAGLGTEMYAGTPEELDWLMRFRPTLEATGLVHLSRGLDLFEENSREQIAQFAARFAGRVRGFVVHDQPALILRADDYLRAVRDMNARLERIENCSWLFIEYAAGLDPVRFAKFFQRIRELRRVSACIDSGHVGIWQTRAAYAERHPGEDICTLKPMHPKFPLVLRDVEVAVRSALHGVLELIEALSGIGKPVHFHLHDGHPASTFSPFGVSDHLSFLAEIPIPFAYDRRHALPTMFGPDGLKKIVATALAALGANNISLTFEIHPTGEQLPLGDAANLFSHWSDKINAEKMNHWLGVITQNARLLEPH